MIKMEFFARLETARGEEHDPNTIVHQMRGVYDTAWKLYEQLQAELETERERTRDLRAELAKTEAERDDAADQAHTAHLALVKAVWLLPVKEAK